MSLGLVGMDRCSERPSLTLGSGIGSSGRLALRSINPPVAGTVDRIGGKTGTNLLLEGLPGSAGGRPFEGDGPLLCGETGHLLSIQGKLLCLHEATFGPEALRKQGSIPKEGLNLVRLDTSYYALPEAGLFRLEEGNLPLKLGQDGKGCFGAQGTQDLN